MLSFYKWLEFHYTDKKRGPTISKADMPLRIIQQAGRKGIDRGSIGAHVELPRELLDQLLQALVSTGQATVAREAGMQIYRPR